MSTPVEEQEHRRSVRKSALHTGFSLMLWVSGTLIATLAIWIGVSAATRSVIGSPLATLGAPNVARLAATPSSTTIASTTLPTSTTTPSLTTTTSLPASTPAQSTTTLAATTTTTSLVAANAQSSTTTTRPTNSATFVNKGGRVTVSCIGRDARLGSAIPSNGYALSVQSSGPNRVAVVFTSDSDVAPLAIVCRDGEPVLQPKQQTPPPPPPTSRPTTLPPNPPPPTSG